MAQADAIVGLKEFRSGTLPSTVLTTPGSALDPECGWFRTWMERTGSDKCPVLSGGQHDPSTAHQRDQIRWRMAANRLSGPRGLGMQFSVGRFSRHWFRGIHWPVVGAGLG